MHTFYVKALWDPEAKVFYSETDIPGLTVEASDVAAFKALVMDLAPDMLAENAGIHGAEVKVRFSAEQDFDLAVA